MQVKVEEYNPATKLTRVIEVVEVRASDRRAQRRAERKRQQVQPRKRRHGRVRGR